MVSTGVSSLAAHNSGQEVLRVVSRAGYVICEWSVEQIAPSASGLSSSVVNGDCYASLRMRPLSISCAEGFVVISCGKVDYDKCGLLDD
jgi:hypothetical protein